MKEDPVIAEIRRIRHDLSKKFEHNPKQLINWLQEQEKLHAERIVYFRCNPQKNSCIEP